MNSINKDIKQWEKLVYKIVTNYKNNSFEYRTYIDWDEMKQVGLIALYKCIQGYDNTKGEFSTYVTKAVKRALQRQLLFDKKTENTTPIEDFKLTYEMDENELDKNILRDKIYKIIDSLNIFEKSKTILKLRLENKTLQEIADEVGVTYQCVSSVIHHNLHKIQDRLKEI